MMGFSNSRSRSNEAPSGSGSETHNTSVDDFSACLRADNDIDTTFQFFFGISVFISLGLSFLVRRKKLFLNCCWGRPGILQPVNFFDAIERRWTYASCFIILTYNVMILFNKKSYWDFMPVEDRAWMRKYGWVKVFNKFWEVLSVCLVYYPLLACIDHRRSIAANIVGILYLIPWIWVYSEFFYSCSVHIEWGIFGVKFHLLRAPIYIALYVVGVSYVMDLIQNIKRIKKRRENAKTNGLGQLDVEYAREYEVTHHMEYVSNLLRRRTEDSEDFTGANIIRVKSKKLTERVKYEKVFGFRYSTRLVCCLTVSVTILFWAMVGMGEGMEFLLQLGFKYCEDISFLYSTIPVLRDVVEPICEMIYIIRVLTHTANALSGVVVLLFLINSLITYKRRWHQLLRGDHSWHIFECRLKTPQNVLLNGLKYGGYQVAYAVWGWMVLGVFLWTLFMIFTFGLFLPLTKGRRGWLMTFFEYHWATFALGIIVLPIIQKLVCRFCFLQGKESGLALDNRRVYNAASYYFLVLNIIVGIFSCLRRIVIPLILGITFLSRLDQPLIMKGFERRDPGYSSFVSMLLVDLYHNHPVVKTFVELLLQAKERREAMAGISDPHSRISEERLRRSRRIRNRWLKTVTLINNPSLVLKVLEKRLKDELKTAMSKTTPTTFSFPVHDSVAIEMQPPPYRDEYRTPLSHVIIQ